MDTFYQVDVHGKYQEQVFHVKIATTLKNNGCIKTS